MPIRFQYQNPAMVDVYRPRALDLSPLDKPIGLYMQRKETARANMSQMQDEINKLDIDQEARGFMESTVKDTLAKQGLVDDKGNLKDMGLHYDKYMNAVQTAKSKVAPIVNMANYAKEQQAREQHIKDTLDTDAWIVNSSYQPITKKDENGNIVGIKNKDELTTKVVNAKEFTELAKNYAHALNSMSSEKDWKTNPQHKWMLTQAQQKGFTPEMLETDQGKSAFIESLVEDRYLNNPDVKQYLAQKIQLPSDAQYKENAIKDLQEVYPNIASNLDQQGIKNLDQAATLKALRDKQQDLEQGVKEEAMMDFKHRLYPNLSSSTGSKEMVDQDYLWNRKLALMKQRQAKDNSVILPMSYRNVVDPSQSEEEIRNRFKVMRGEKNAPGNIASAIQKQESLIENMKNAPDYENNKSYYDNAIKASGLIIDRYKKDLQGIEKTEYTPLKDLRKNYSLLRSQFGNDEDAFLKTVEELEIAKSKSKYTLATHPDPIAQDVFTKAMNSFLEKGKNVEFSTLDESLNKDKKIKGSELANEKNKNQIVNSEIDPYHGRIIGYTKNGEIVEMNKDLLSERQENLLNLGSKVIQNQYNFNDESFKPVKSKHSEPLPVGQGYYGFPIYSKGKDGLIHLNYVDEKGDKYTVNKVPIDIPMTEEQFRNDLTGKIYSDVNPSLRENRKPVNIKTSYGAFPQQYMGEDEDLLDNE